MDEDVNAFISSSSPHVRRPTGSGRINRNLHPDSELRRSNGQTRFVPVQHPKLTLYRLSIVLLTAGFGTSKALSAYRGHSSTPTTLEWVYGVVLTIAFYWVGLYEDNPPPQMMWLFDKDYSFDVLRATRTLISIAMDIVLILTWFGVAFGPSYYGYKQLIPKTDNDILFVVITYPYAIFAMLYGLGATAVFDYLAHKLDLCRWDLGRVS